MRPEAGPRPKRSVVRRVVRTAAWMLRSKQTIGALAAVYDEAGRILLVRQKLYERHRWTLPGGFIKGDERPVEAVVREIREEVALSLDMADFEEVAHYKQPWAQHLDVLFKIQLEESEPELNRLSRTEIAEAQWIDIDDEAPELTAEAVVALEILRGNTPDYLRLFWWSYDRSD